MAIDKSPGGLDKLLDESERYLEERLQSLNPHGIMGSMELLIMGVSATGVAVMLHYGNKQKGYDFLDRVTDYAITTVPVLTHEEKEAIAAEADGTHVSDCQMGEMANQIALRKIKERGIDEAIKPVYTTLSVLALFSTRRDYTSEQKIRDYWTHMCEGDRHVATYQYRLDNLAASYSKAIELLRGIEPAKIREIAVKHHLLG